MLIRPTLEHDIQYLPDVERSAAQAFAGWPALAWLAQADVMDCAAHRLSPRAVVAGLLKTRPGRL